MTLPSDRPITSPALIGRAAQLHTLTRLYERTASGQGQIALISGEAGIGKSRLVAETLRSLSTTTRVLQGRCFEQDQTLPYAPLLDMPELAHHLSSIAPDPALDPEQEKRRRHQSLADFLLGMVASQPLVLVLEDVHWGDDASLEFITFLTRSLPAQPVLLLLTYRDDEVRASLAQFLAGLDRQRLATELRLKRLSRDETKALLNSMFDQNSPLAADFLDTLYDLTEGNPFFIEEVLKSLIMTGDLFYTRGKWERKPLDEIHIPRTVQVAVQQRAARLTAEASHVLTLAAVAGRRFDFGLLHHLTQQDEKALLDLMRELMTAQLVVEETADIFAFRHALTRQAVYAELLVRERRALHRSIAEALEQLYPEGAARSGRLADLAYHAYEGEQWETAFEYARRAGEQAQRLYAPHAALDYFNRAVLAAGHLREAATAELYRMRGQTHELLGNLDAAHEDYETAATSARHTGNLREEWQSQLDLGFLWSSRDWGRAGEYLEKAITLARQMDDPAILARSLNRVGNWYANQEQPQEALRCHEEALSIFEQLNDQRGLTATLDLLGVTNLMAGNMVASAHFYQQSVAHYRQLGDRPGLSSSLALFSMRGGSYMVETVYCNPAPLTACLKDGEEALAIAREMGSLPAEAGVLMYAGLMLGARGDFARALMYGQRGLELANRTEHQLWISGNDMLLGRFYLDALDLTAAQRHLEASLALAKSIRAYFIIGATTGFLASTYIAESRLAQAESLLRMTLRLDSHPVSAETMNTQVKRIMWGAQAELYLATGQPDSALEVLAYLMALAHTPDDAPGVPRLLYLRGEALAARYDFREAQDVLETALTAAENQDVPPLLWRIKVALGKVYQANGRRQPAEDQFDEAHLIIEQLAKALPDTELRQHFLSRANALIPTLPLLSARQSARQTYDGLTEREREIAVQVAEGKSSREIAEALILSKRTVDSHIANILAKLGYSSRSQIARWAVEKGLV